MTFQSLLTLLPLDIGYIKREFPDITPLIVAPQRDSAYLQYFRRQRVLADVAFDTAGSLTAQLNSGVEPVILLIRGGRLLLAYRWSPKSLPAAQFLRSLNDYGTPTSSSDVVPHPLYIRGEL